MTTSARIKCVGFLLLLIDLTSTFGSAGINSAKAFGQPAGQSSQALTFTITPATAEIRAGDAQRFTTSITTGTGGSDAWTTFRAGRTHRGRRRLNWSVNGIPGGNAALGTIDRNGLFTAPAIVPYPNIVELAVTRAGRTSLSATARITLNNPVPQLLSVSPKTVSPGRLALTIHGSKFVRGAQVWFGGTPLPTTFISHSQLTANATATEAQVGDVRVSVTNSDPGSASSLTTLTIKVKPPVDVAPSIVVTPAAAQIRSGNTQQFSVATSAKAQNVYWSVNGIRGGNTTVGSIDAKGQYRAPAIVPNPNTVHVTATSTADPSVSTTVPLTLYNPVPVVTSASPTALSVGSFTLTVLGKNFVRGARVTFAGNALTTTFNSDTQLTAGGKATEAEVGSVSVFVTNPEPGSSSSAEPFTIEVKAPPDVSQADVLVDAGRTVSDTGSDDLAAAKNIYASASAPEADGGLNSDWNLISSQFAMKRMRNINGLGDCDLDSAGHLTGCSRLNGDLANMKMRNLTPHVIVGQWAPASIGGNSLQWGTSQWAAYDALCYAIVNYVANQYGGSGFTEVLFEVGNEIDTTMNAQDLWLTTSPSVPQGDPSRFAQFDTVYRHWAKAVDLVARQSAQKKIRIAGPATGFWTAYYGSGALWHNQLIQKYAALGIRLDVVSLHVYGGHARDLAKYARSIRDTLIASGNPKAEIWVTEWGASDASDIYFGLINGSHEAAPWAINFLLQALKGSITGGSFLLVRDNHGHDTVGANANMGLATWNHVENSVEYPKAVANAFTMVDRMKGARKSVTVNAAKPDLKAFAASDATSASVIVANYNYMFDYASKNYSDATSNQTVRVAFTNLPFDGAVTVDRYLIDANTSNLHHWVAAGQTPPSVQATQLQRVESFSATCSGGKLVLAARQLGQSAVSMWRVHR